MWNTPILNNTPRVNNFEYSSRYEASIQLPDFKELDDSSWRIAYDY